MTIDLAPAQAVQQATRLAAQTAEADAIGTCQGIPRCTCGQLGVTGLYELHDLMAAGMDQWTASVVLWSTPAAHWTPGDSAALRAWIRREFTRAFPWLRLPAADEAEVVR